MALTKHQQNSMLSGNLFGSIVRYTIPVMLTGLLQLLFNAADLIIVGRYCGSLSVAAVGATGSISFLFFSIFNGISGGCGIVTARFFGARDDRNVCRAIANSA